MSSTHKVYVPIDAAALSVGANEVAREIRKQANDRKLEIEIIRNGSRGMLWLEPLVEVETAQGRIGYGAVNASDVKSLFEAGFLSGGTHKLRQGVTEEIPYFASQKRLTFARCGRTDPVNLCEYENYGGWAGLRKALKISAQEIVNVVKESGVRGRGGAGFPAGVKWNTALRANSDTKYICCNADEGDSGTFADRMLLEGDPFCLIEGMIIAGLAVGAEDGYVYLRSEYPNAIKTVKTAIEICKSAGFLGDNIDRSGRKFDLSVRVGAGAYICGEETSMLESLEGKRGEIKVKPPIPAINGLFGKPTIVNNVLTLATVPIILAKGAKFYQDFGIGGSRGTQPFQLGGDIGRGGLVEIAFGISLKELVEDFGGGTRSGRPVKAVQVGGPLGAHIPPSELTVKMGYESLSKNGAMLGHGGIVVFNEDTDMAGLARYAMEFCAIESCGKCTPCRIGAMRGTETIDKIIGGIDVEENIEVLEDLCELMTEASLCAMGGLTPMPVKSALTHFPDDFTRRGTK